MISVRGLAIGYDGVAILQGLDFDVEAREVFVILGGSGCGKSTLLRHLIGLQAPMAGTIRIDEPRRASRLGGPRFGVTFQAGALFSSMTLQENVALPLVTWTDLGPEAIAAISLARLRLVGLGGFENHLPAEISGGMRKRAAIARALALDPELLFLDEPSAGLDPVSAVELDDLIRTLRDDLGVTTVIVTHELESIFRIGIVASCSTATRAASSPRAIRASCATDPPTRASTASSTACRRRSDMATTLPTNRWKLGLFVTLGFLGMILILGWLGATRLRRESTEVHYFFDQEVNGLEIGSPIKFRGVPVGKVVRIRAASDQRHVEVVGQIFVDSLEAIGLPREDEPDPEDGPFVPDDLRVQLVTNFLTGVAFIQGDFFDPEVYPIPEYPFEIPYNTVHAVTSTAKTLEDAFRVVAERIPELTEEFKHVLLGIEQGPRGHGLRRALAPGSVADANQ